MIESLQSELEASRAALAEKDSLLVEKDSRIAEMEAIIAKLQRMLFGRSSEKNVLPTPLPAHGQTDLFTAEQDPEGPSPEEMKEEASDPPLERKRKPAPKKSIPDSIPRIDVQIDIQDSEKACPCCGKPRVCIGDDVTERLEIVPQQLYVKRIVRPRYACGGCKNAVAQAPLPSTPIDRSAASASLLAWLLISKYEDHAPLCRQERIMGRLGIDLPRRKTSEWLMQVADLLAPLVARIRQLVATKSAVIGADETSLDVMNGKGKSVEQGWLWIYRGDDAAPYTLFEFCESRGVESPKAMLDSFTGWLMSDAYAVYPSVNQSIQRGGGSGFRQVICWAHARRGFVDAQKSGDKRGDQLIDLIGRLYGIERDAAGLDPPERFARRQQESIPILSQIRDWLDNNTQITALGKTALGKAIGYALDHWEELCVSIRQTDGCRSTTTLSSARSGQRLWGAKTGSLPEALAEPAPPPCS